MLLNFVSLLLHVSIVNAQKNLQSHTIVSCQMKSFQLWGESWRTNEFDSDIECIEEQSCDGEVLPLPTCTSSEIEEGARRCAKIEMFIDSDADCQVCTIV